MLALDILILMDLVQAMEGQGIAGGKAMDPRMAMITKHRINTKTREDTGVKRISQIL